jgi:formamidopyrimidine-DNA glycosylase
MPELPDIEVFRRLVERDCIGLTVSNIDVVDAACLVATTPALMTRRLKRHTLDGAARHGKVLFLRFGGAGVLAMHFGPAGSLGVVVGDAALPPYVRLRMDLSGGSQIAFADRRRIGRVQLAASLEASVAESQLGPDTLDPAFDATALARSLAGTRTPIKLALIDQSRLAGIGNTYSDEILFQARLHPARPARSLDAAETRSLMRSIRHVLRTAIACDPTQADFRERLPRSFLLPQRQPGGHCPRDETPLERMTLGGRTATFCSKCQAEVQTQS